MTGIEIGEYREIAARSLQNQTLQQALSCVQGRIGRATSYAYRQLPEGPGLRQVGHELRLQALLQLDVLLQELADRIRSRGGKVFFAANKEEAVRYCLETAVKNRVKQVVKGKSMVTEEIGLNQALFEAGIEATETDLGEYIIQLAGERPSHIIAPAIHKTRQEVGRLFADKLGIPYTEDPALLTRAARRALREKFFAADMGITGCNLACAETGHITTLSNEGNIRMSTSMPRIHLAIMGMERVVAKLEDQAVLFRLLSRGAAAQSLATYISYAGGPAGPDEIDGPQEFHLIILDNGRSRILADPEFREILCCVRCGACLNVCPVYGKIGGYAYGHPYTGPIGAVLNPLLAGLEKGRDLFFGETLCGACQEACPVNIDLPRMLLALRARLIEGDAGQDLRPKAGAMENAAFWCWSKLAEHRRLYEAAHGTASLAQRVLPADKG
ncbi:MAG: iron-sulfur cluster-binding protein, partial [Desulfohalobiaceae bacterium]|nr:iron-sulfur cluster-binding protein [Desulfohalobiaceae bacterium]